MPTYDYVCRFCNHTFEHFQGIHDALLRKCPECGRHGLRRLFGAGAGVVFKGSGFYETDYKRKGGGGDKPLPGKPGGTSGKEGAEPAGKGGDGKASGVDKGNGKGDSTGDDKGGGSAHKGNNGSDTKPT